MPNDSSEAIRDLVTHMQLHIRSLKALGRSWEDIANDILTSIVISKMEPDTRRTWERTLIDTEVPKIADIFKYLHRASHQSKEYNTTSSLSSRKYHTKNNNTYNIRPRTPPSSPPMQRRQTYATRTSSNLYTPPSSPRPQRKQENSPRQNRKPYTNDPIKCSICSESHATYHCPTFLDMPINKRIEAARKAQLCLNCLRFGHQTVSCRSGRCRVCNKLHNTKLHLESHSETNS
ncbi:hypothetical protein WN55_06859 [Dufourea novaeangliae]|uniref:CCHC-type domain-containing protein n=1 Tax=Dufourea novaeangliae TaxID=178035 RepID=A0A154P212_DUFNO|nr:hypothetical protein WN55_06859 [Dufourea novaeangliae]